MTDKTISYKRMGKFNKLNFNANALFMVYGWTGV